ncbi:hypothetical protein BB561_006315 [Smittium simulii]|uniref:Cytosolic Fe-S cluster assembly factor CFD1 n=1 Tax=Smittium simulii TaxID=133385 RepID=A0A2T9Y576_9FUNG|nr:hypothetical protein BB561_006315 [Smittium simulii]
MAGSTDFPGLEKVKHIVLVLSGKGGVGKSSVSVQLAVALKELGNKVGILDLDLCGPSIPRMLGVEKSKIHQASSGWVPVYITPDRNFSVMSIGFLLPDKNSSVVWRGPKKSDLDYLIIDTPPGTSDEHLSVVENLQALKLDGAILVTTPQAVSLVDVRKELNFCHQVKLPVLGLVENMSGYVCTNCKECTNIFSSGGGKKLAEEFKLNFFGSVPIDPSLVEQLDISATGCDEFERYSKFIQQYKSSALYEIFTNFSISLQNSLN